MGRASGTARESPPRRRRNIKRHKTTASRSKTVYKAGLKARDGLDNGPFYFVPGAVPELSQLNVTSSVSCTTVQSRTKNHEAKKRSSLALVGLTLSDFEPNKVQIQMQLIVSVTARNSFIFVRLRGFSRSVVRYINLM